MGKKREREERDPDAMEGSSDEDFDMVNVDFEWFNFNAQTDFHGTKTLLRQLLDVDAPLQDVSALADLILSQPTIGSTVKVGGEETDAYALLTALGLSSHKEHEGLKTLVAYLERKAGGEVAAALSGGKDVGLVLGERLINMPSEVAPPLYAMLLEELDDAVEDGEPYAFEHFVVLSRVYREVAPDPEVQGSQQPDRKRVKEATASSTSTQPGEVFHFHPEDEVLRRFASATASFVYDKEDESVADSKRAFSEMGIRTEGLVMVLEKAKFGEAVAAMKGFLGGA